jgi:mono/diheme cytochrome c family protein
MRIALTLLALGVVACSDSGPPLSPEAQRGRAAWLASCTACHAADPNLEGALGPAVAGSSRELVEARVLRAEYPPGYTPKRDSRAMVALPHLAGEIDALFAYLAEAKR